METEAIKFKTVGAIWWAFIWRAVLIGGIFGLCGGAIIGATLAATGKTHLMNSAILIFSLVLSLPVNILALWLALRGRYRNKYVVLSADNPRI